MAGLDSCPLDEQRSSFAVALERVRLAPGAVEREHELGARALAQRLVANPLLELGDQLAVTAQRERAVDALLGDDEAILVEAGGVDLRVALDFRACEGIAAPERERSVVGVAVPRRDRLRSLSRERSRTSVVKTRASSSPSPQTAR